MTRRFQFSLRALLNLTACAALTAWFWSSAGAQGIVGTVAALGFPLAAGAGAWQLIGRPVRGAVVVYAIYFLFASAVLLIVYHR
ncbi:MAG TPA: hypothetical protein VHC22_14285 [Pirellulales bacterium]|nr:hypothetical protein [Pirellulales bacterium]